MNVLNPDSDTHQRGPLWWLSLKGVTSSPRRSIVESRHGYAVALNFSTEFPVACSVKLT